jgi:phosphoribosylaminoimidazolecarboxamide formyltransferase/IMP cyclohydrolase
MNTTKRFSQLTISKEGLEPIVRKLHSQNVVLYSTGGTEDFIKNLGIPVTALKMSLSILREE